jgi:SHS2 domain-containing protein
MNLSTYAFCVMPATSSSVEHVGEWKVAITADTLEELFVEVMRVIAQQAVRSRARPGAWEQLSISARDLPTLLADWANELLGRSESHCAVYADMRNARLILGTDGTSTISAEVRGRPLGRWASPLKAATYHGLSLEKHGAAWRGVILFDV